MGFWNLQEKLEKTFLVCTLKTVAVIGPVSDFFFSLIDFRYLFSNFQIDHCTKGQKISKAIFLVCPLKYRINAELANFFLIVI
jgi:hypothetical protein